MAYSTISGILKDSDGIAWKQATWTAVPVSPSSKPVFPDGTPVPTTSGTLDDLGTFSGQVPQTSSILPPGTTLTVTITSLTSYAPVTLTKVQIIAPTTNMGSLLSPRIPAPRIQASAIVYAYAAVELIKPVHGNGYVNTVEEQSYLFMQNTWVKIGSIPNFDAVTANSVDVNGPLTAESVDVSGEIEATGPIVANGGLVSALNALGTIPPFTPFGPGGYRVAWNIPSGFGNTIFVNYHPNGVGGGFRWYNELNTATIDPSTVPAMALDNGGSLTVIGSLFSATGASFRGVVETAPNALNISNTGGAQGLTYLDFSGPDAATEGGARLRTVSSDGSKYNEVMQINPGGVVVEGTLTGGANTAGSFTVPSGALSITWNLKNGIGETDFVNNHGGVGGGFAWYNGGNGQVLTTADQALMFLDHLGNFSVVGTITASAKPFKIPHPLDPEKKWLFHGCVEGPEYAVFYRGEGVTESGAATITLPPYFEALTRESGRTVQLTERVDDGDGDAVFGCFLAATAVVDGRFTVRSSNPRALFYWEVKATRRDVSLEVEVDRDDDLDQARVNQAGTDAN